MIINHKIVFHYIDNKSTEIDYYCRSNGYISPQNVKLDFLQTIFDASGNGFWFMNFENCREPNRGSDVIINLDKVKYIEFGNEEMLEGDI